MVHIRRANKNDLLVVSTFALKLSEQHRSYNPLRFISFDNHQEQLFEFFNQEIQNQKTVILVAEYGEKIVGYAFIRLEEASLIEISQECAWLHDIYVDEQARGLNAGKELMQAAIKAAREELASPILMLHVAPHNEFGRKMFEKYGFQATMMEMMLDLSER